MEIHIEQRAVLSDNKYRLETVTYRCLTPRGVWEEQRREVYDRGDAAAILLYDKERGMVVLTQQFRLPPYLSHGDKLLTEACAGKLDGESPEEAIRRECMEETGYRVGTLQKIMEAYTSPASVTELIHLFIAPYSPEMKTGAGGGLASEQEYIEVREMPYAQALQMVEGGGIRDAKTIILLQYLRLKGIL